MRRKVVFQILLILIIGSIVNVSGCKNNEEEFWKKVQSENTIAMYEEYIKKYPNGNYTDQARAAIEEIATYEKVCSENNIESYKRYLKQYPHGRYVSQLEEKVLKLKFSEGKVIRIMVMQNYEKANKVNLPFYELTKKIFWEYTDFYPVKEDSMMYNGTFSIKARGIASCDSIKGKCVWTTATIEGEIFFSIKGGKAISWDFFNTYQELAPAESKFLTPNDAPFEKAFSEGFLVGLFKAIRDLKGLAPLVSALKDEDSRIRHSALQALKKINPKWAETEEAKKLVPEFISALKNKEWVVRFAAVKVLGEIKDSIAIKPIISTLKDENDYVREAAVIALRNMKNLQETDIFLNALKDKYVGVREAAAEALRDRNDPRAVEALIFTLKDENPYVRKKAVETLGKIRDRRAVQPLILALNDKVFWVRGAVIEALGQIKDPQCIKPLTSVLRDEEWSVRFLGAKALGEIGEIKDPDALQALISALADKDLNVRNAAADALEKINPQWMKTKEAKKMVPEFIKAMKEEEWDVRIAAANVLGKIKDTTAANSLISALKDENINVRIAALEALREIRTSKSLKALILALIDENWEFKQVASKVLEETNPKWMETREAQELISELISALKNKNWSIRMSAVETLGEIKDPSAIKPLSFVMHNDEILYVRISAVKALGKINDPQALHAIITALKNENMEVQQTAFETISKINPNWGETEEAKRMVIEFISSLKDENYIIRTGSARALGEIKDSRAVNPLISALKDEYSNVREAAAEALKKITGMDFGTDYNEWNSWLQSEKDKNIKK